MSKGIPIIALLIFLAANSMAGEIVLKNRVSHVQAEKCQLCHIKQDLPYIPQKHQPVRQHQGYSLQHAGIEMSCNNCHDVAHSNFLKSTPEFPASFSNSSAVCQRCHSEVFSDWENGIHGKRTGKWNGEKVQFHCIDCHDPHAVRFKPMKAMPAPSKPRMGVTKTEPKD